MDKVQKTKLINLFIEMTEELMVEVKETRKENIDTALVKEIRENLTFILTL